MTTEAGGVRVITPLAPGPAERIVHFWTCTATNSDVVTIPDSVTYVHEAWAVANATSHGGAAALSNEEITIETATKLDEVLFQAGNDEYLTGFSVSDIDEADDISGAGTAASDINYYKAAPGPSDGNVSSGVSTGGMRAVYFEATVTSDRGIPFDKVGIDKVIGAVCFSVASRAFTVAEATLGDADEMHKVKITTGALVSADVRGIVWGYQDKAQAALNIGTTITNATSIKIWKLWPGPAECNFRMFQNTEVSTNEGITITGMTEARFALAHKIAAGISTINAVTCPASASTELNMVKITTANTTVDVRGIVLGDLGQPGWSS